VKKYQQYLDDERDKYVKKQEAKVVSTVWSIQGGKLVKIQNVRPKARPEFLAAQQNKRKAKTQIQSKGAKRQKVEENKSHRRMDVDDDQSAASQFNVRESQVNQLPMIGGDNDGFYTQARLEQDMGQTQHTASQSQAEDTKGSSSQYSETTGIKKKSLTVHPSLLKLPAGAPTPPVPPVARKEKKLTDFFPSTSQTGQEPKSLKIPKENSLPTALTEEQVASKRVEEENDGKIDLTADLDGCLSSLGSQFELTPPEETKEVARKTEREGRKLQTGNSGSKRSEGKRRTSKTPVKGSTSMLNLANQNPRTNEDAQMLTDVGPKEQKKGARQKVELMEAELKKKKITKALERMDKSPISKREPSKAAKTRMEASLARLTTGISLPSKPFSEKQKQIKAEVRQQKEVRAAKLIEARSRIEMEHSQLKGIDIENPPDELNGRPLLRLGDGTPAYWESLRWGKQPIYLTPEEAKSLDF